MVEAKPTSSTASSSSSTPSLVLDSLPLGTDEGETQVMHSSEMEMIATELKHMSPKTTFVPEAPVVTCFQLAHIMFPYVHVRCEVVIPYHVVTKYQIYNEHNYTISY